MFLCLKKKTLLLEKYEFEDDNACKLAGFSKRKISFLSRLK
jgi:hypothetical protein